MLTIAKDTGRLRRVLGATSVPLELVAVGDTLYWWEADRLFKHHRVFRFAWKGRPVVVANGLGLVAALVPFGDRLYWVAGDTSVPYTLHSVGLDGLGQVELGPVDSVGTSESELIWARGADVFVGDTFDRPSRTYHGPEHVTLSALRGIRGSVYGTEAAWRRKGSHPARLWRLDPSGGCRSVLAESWNLGFHEGIHVVLDTVYWIDRKAGGIMAVAVR